jgi:adenosylhomocysteine nucleosidase
MRNRLGHALKWAVFLARGPLIMPTSDLVQTSVAPTFAEEFQLLATNDLLYFVGSTIDPANLQANKIAHFGGTQLHPEWYEARTRGRLTGFQEYMQARAIDTTSDIRAHWSADVASLGEADGSSRYPVRQLLQARDLMSNKPAPSRFEAGLEKIPERLESHAFLWNVIEALKILPFEIPPTAGRHFEMSLGWNWTKSYLDEYQTTMIGRIPGIGFVECGVKTTNPELVVDLVAYDTALNILGLGEYFRALTVADIVQMRMDPHIVFLKEGVLSDLYALLARSGSSRPDTGEMAVLTRQIDFIRQSSRASYSPQAAIAAAAACAVSAFEMPMESNLAARTTDPPIGNSARLPMAKSLSAVADARYRNSGVPRRPIVILVALVEELGTILKLVREMVGDVAIVDEDDDTGRILYSTDFGENQLLFALAGKGQERSAAATALILARYRPTIAVNIGIAGALSDDLHIGDVIIGDQIVSYLANAKATPDGADGFTVGMAGDALRSDELLVERASQLPFIRPVEFQAARERVARGAVPALASLMRADGFEISAGPIACGPVVGAARAFRNWLKAWKRDFVAVDMETSGVAIATSLSGAIRHIRYVAIRGISDMADEDKNKLEAETKNSSRHAAMRSSLEVLLLLVDSLPRSIIG